MLCNNCGNEVPMGQPNCPYCGAPVAMDMGAQQPYQQAPMGMDQQYQQAPMGMQQPYQQAPMGMQQPYQPAAPAKSKKGLIIGLIAGIVAIAAIVVVLVLFVFNKGDADGVYVCDEYAAFGMDMQIEIDGDEFIMTMSAYGETETIEGECEVDGDTIILTYDGDSLECDYDAKEGTIDFEGMIFEKE